MKNMKNLVNIGRKAVNRLRENKLSKKLGDDKLIVGLILVVIGIFLCVIYKKTVVDVVSKAITDLAGKIEKLLEDTTGGILLLRGIK